MAGTRKPSPTKAPAVEMHPRNRHRGRYDFEALTAQCPELGAFVAMNPFGDLSIDFANPLAVKTLNRSILKHFYGVAHWDIPPGYLCPPIPGRADMIHHLADLLGTAQGGVIPRGRGIRALDIGVGANCVYPLIGHREYGWSFLGSEIDPQALTAAQGILEANPGLTEAIELRRQPESRHIFRGLLKADECFDLTLCNPPFHASADQAREGTERKWRNLGRNPGARSPVLNFGGQGAELWCPGGEAAFIGRMIAESVDLGSQCLWFTTLVSKSANLPGILKTLRAAGVAEHREILMGQGQKVSRLVAWTFQNEARRAQWVQRRWGSAS